MNRSTSLRMRSSNASWSSNACGMGDQHACKKIRWKNIAPTFKSCQAIGLPQTRDSGPVLHSQTAGRWAPRSSQLWSQSLRPDLCCILVKQSDSGSQLDLPEHGCSSAQRSTRRREYARLQTSQRQSSVCTLRAVSYLQKGFFMIKDSSDLIHLWMD